MFTHAFSATTLKSAVSEASETGRGGGEKWEKWKASFKPHFEDTIVYLI